MIWYNGGRIIIKKNNKKNAYILFVSAFIVWEAFSAASENVFIIYYFCRCLESVYWKRFHFFICMKTLIKKNATIASCSVANCNDENRIDFHENIYIFSKLWFSKLWFSKLWKRFLAASKNNENVFMKVFSLRENDMKKKKKRGLLVLLF